MEAVSNFQTEPFGNFKLRGLLLTDQSVLMHWSGAYEGFMSGSLDRDIGEMNALVNHLHSNGAER
jgi:hypothetical protein